MTAISEMRGSKHDAEAMKTPDDASAEDAEVDRKRQRDRQRRSDLTRATEDLCSLVVRIDPSILNDAESILFRLEGEPSINRTELMRHAANVLERVHRENEERKGHISHLMDLLSTTEFLREDQQVERNASANSFTLRQLIHDSNNHRHSLHPA